MSAAEGYDCVLAIDNVNLKLPFEERLCEKEFFNTKVKCFFFDELLHKELNLPYIAGHNKISKFQKIMWACADYRFYYVKKYFPNYDFYWQFDYDVFCNGASYEQFLKKYENSDADFLILNLREEDKNSDWVWTKNVDWIYGKEIKLYGSFYPASRLSSNAIDFLYKKRIEHAKIFLSNKFKKAKWPNCEIFTPTELMNNNFKCEEIIEENIKYDEYDLNEERIFEKPDNKLYHSVKGDFLSRLKKISSKKSIKLFNFKISFEKYK